MKYIALLLLGVVSATQHQSTSLSHLSVRQQLAQAMNSESDDDSSDDESEMVQLDGDSGIIDALTPQAGACKARLWINEEELATQMDNFSRTFDK
jgi:hypothetical protein